MLELQRIRSERSLVEKALKKRGWNDSQIDILDRVIAADDKRKSIQTENDARLAKRNTLSREIGEFYKNGQKEKAEALKKDVEALKFDIQQAEEALQDTRKEIEELLLNIPNMAHHSVPAGQNEENNEIVRQGDVPLPELDDAALPHWELAKKYDILDFETGVKITGAGFPVFKGKGARLERALINFFLDEATSAGYLEVIPPLMVNEDTARGTGQLPDKEGQMYYIERDDLYLIPTAEVPLTNIYRGDIVQPDDLPIKVTGYTPCFRREAGSYGSDVKGLNRVHQFDKIEIVQVVHPDTSYETLDQMVAYVEGLIQKLELPYRILRLCGGDLSFASALTYDFEVYSAAQGKWLEVSSVSNFESFQSNRLMLRYRDEQGKTQLAHTLNGSALALARVVAAIIENNQTAEGIVMPEALRNYTGFNIIN